jgi:uncharacterized tellurite resistance protein B-like protein
MSILDLIKQNFSTRREQQDTETVAIRKIIQSLDQLDQKRATFIAAFAYLLSRVAGADMHVSPEETRMMERIVMQQGGLPEQQAVIVVQMAKTQNRLFGGTENFLVTREFSTLARHEDKLRLLDCMYAIAAADKSISTVEDNEISQVADELRVEHHERIAIRSRYRDHLAVLKDSETT